MDRLLDLRFVIGLFFLLIGILLLGHSFLSNSEDQSVNQWCGGTFVLFGIVMLLLSSKKVASKTRAQENIDKLFPDNH